MTREHTIRSPTCTPSGNWRTERRLRLVPVHAVAVVDVADVVSAAARVGVVGSSPLRRTSLQSMKLEVSQREVEKTLGEAADEERGTRIGKEDE